MPFALSLLINALIIAALCMMSVSGCSSEKKEEIIPMEFLVVTEENAADVLSEEPNDAREEESEPKSEPKSAKSEPLPPPPPPVQEPDSLPPPPPIEEQKPTETPKQETKKPEPQKPKETSKEKPKAKPKWKPATTIKTGKRIGPVTDGKKDRTKAATQKAPSKEEIAKALGAGAKPGNRNQTPANETSRCYGLLKKCFREACQKSGLESSPTGRSPVLIVRLGPGGSVRGVTLKTSSGDTAFDGQVLRAVRTVRAVSGLSDSFLRGHPTVEIQVNVD